MLRAGSQIKKLSPVFEAEITTAQLLVCLLGEHRVTTRENVPNKLTDLRDKTEQSQGEGSPRPEGTQADQETHSKGAYLWPRPFLKN